MATSGFAARRAAAAAALAAAVGVASGALADTLAVTAEVDERAAPLDIASIGHGHDARGRLVHRVTMQAPWRLRALRPGRGELALLFDVDGEFVDGHPRFERALVVETRRAGSTPRCEVDATIDAFSAA